MKQKLKILFSHIVVLVIVSVCFGYIYSILPEEYFEFKDKIDPYYFSFTTMSTVGYGDYSPKHWKAKLIVIIQEIIITINTISMVFGF